MNREKITQFPINPAGVISLAIRFTTAEVLAKRDSWRLLGELVSLNFDFFYEWFHWCSSTDEFLDLCSSYGLTQTLQTRLSDVRFFYYLLPDTLADFMIYCRDVTRGAELNKVDPVRARLLFHKIKYDLLFDVPAFVEHVTDLIDKMCVSPSMKAELDRSGSIINFINLSNFVMSYCSQDTSFYQPVPDAIPEVEAVDDEDEFAEFDDE